LLIEKARALREQIGVSEHGDSSRERAEAKRQRDVGTDAGGFAGANDDDRRGRARDSPPAAAGPGGPSCGYWRMSTYA
jgi:hypothetical protein